MNAECVCEGEFPVHCGPECDCWHHDMRPEYDFSEAERGKYYDRARQGIATPSATVEVAITLTEAEALTVVNALNYVAEREGDWPEAWTVANKIADALVAHPSYVERRDKAIADILAAREDRS